MSYHNKRTDCDYDIDLDFEYNNSDYTDEHYFEYPLSKFIKTAKEQKQFENFIIMLE